jgi:hypothetical protein
MARIESRLYYIEDRYRNDEPMKRLQTLILEFNKYELKSDTDITRSDLRIQTDALKKDLKLLRKEKAETLSKTSKLEEELKDTHATLMTAFKRK